MLVRRARPRATLLALAVLLGLGLAGPAAAHDQLLESDPAAGDVLDVSPEAITLTFSADILELSSQVVVTDAAGQVVLDSPGEIRGPALVATIEHPFDAGEYLVTWRVVSSDGHPIDGTFAFVVLGSPEPEPEPTVGPEATTEPGPTETPAPAPSPTASIEAPTGDVRPPVRDLSAWPVVLSGVLLLLAGAWFTYRNRHR